MTSITQPRQWRGMGWLHERDISTQQSASWAIYGPIRRSLSVTMQDYLTSRHTKPPRMTGFGAIRRLQEALPHNMPEPRGELVKLWGYFDASHASCLKTRTIGNRHPLIHQQLSDSLVLQKAEHSGDINIWIGAHCWEDSSRIHHWTSGNRLQMFRSSSQRILHVVRRQSVYDHEYDSSRFRT